MTPTSVFIIEDEQALLETIRLRLERAGFSVQSATDGRVGLEKIQAHQPDLILLDLLLPTMAGEDILKAIKQDPNCRDIPVIIISNSGQPVEIEKLLKLGADDYIIKANFTIDDILECIENTLQKRKGQPDVLIAEDEAILRLLLQKKIKAAGFKTITTVNGQSTLDTIIKTHPQVVLLDLLMPDMSGIKVLEALAVHPQYNKDQTKIYIISNYTDKKHDPVIEQLTSGYFIKSDVDINQLITLLRSVVQPAKDL